MNVGNQMYVLMWNEPKQKLYKKQKRTLKNFEIISNIYQMQKWSTDNCSMIRSFDLSTCSTGRANEFVTHIKYKTF